jgi:hypothetical protein
MLGPTPGAGLAAACIGEEEPYTFRVAAAIKNNYGYNSYASIQLYFFPDDLSVGFCFDRVLEPGQFFTCTSQRAFHTYPVAGEAGVYWNPGPGVEWHFRRIYSPAFNPCSPARWAPASRTRPEMSSPAPSTTSPRQAYPPARRRPSSSATRWNYRESDPPGAGEQVPPAGRESSPRIRPGPACSPPR